MSYDMIDRFLRNNLNDDDYAEYSAALDELCTPPAQRKPLTDEAIATVYWGATGQSLRPQDNVLAHNFARAIEAAHGRLNAGSRTP